MLGERGFVAKIVMFYGKKKSSDWGSSHTSWTITLSLPRRDTAAAPLLHGFPLQHEISYVNSWCSFVFLELPTPRDTVARAYDIFQFPKRVSLRLLM